MLSVFDVTSKALDVLFVEVKNDPLEPQIEKPATVVMFLSCF